MNYRIEFVKQAAKQFKKLSSSDRQRLKLKIDALTQDPRPNGVVKLSGPEDLYRIRVGDYRVIYNIQDNRLLVLILKIGHRRDIYR
ncbi:type II toxin-antitoxin system RelE/ParE family toxin [Pleurocapsa sp. PCC 7319]|uniref:type II toxin-antitoxin system RelE family toxin n=1 Tax=Pleurocapsa sp. PCC 7319 TaxID=118161 RepID=UPI00034763B3|nr:type II toxin-antitoxin system RelE/ParE family toxin [Pleurocapsa sp. PCC 7319]